MPDLHSYQTDSGNVLSDLTSGENFVTPPVIPFLGFLAATVGHMLDPINLLGSVLLGVFSRSVFSAAG